MDVPQSAAKDAPLTVEQASKLVGDDIAYWLGNPFMDRDAITAKVCWWITQARILTAGELAEVIETDPEQIAWFKRTHGHLGQVVTRDLPPAAREGES